MVSTDVIEFPHNSAVRIHLDPLIASGPAQAAFETLFNAVFANFKV